MVQMIWKVWVRVGTHKLGVEQHQASFNHHKTSITNKDFYNTYPDEWKCIKTALNYTFCTFNFEPSTRIHSTMFVIIITHSNHSISTKNTHLFKATLTLNSKLPFCTAKSISATASSFNAVAVFSIRSSQQPFCLCISFEQHWGVSL